MSLLAATGDTWGISGPTFLTGYLTAVGLVVVGSLVHRARLFAGSRFPGYDQLGPQQAAYLNGGARLALYSAIGALRGAGAIGADHTRMLRVTGPVPAGATPLDQAVHRAARSTVRARDLPRDHWVATALQQLRQDLEGRGLILSAEQQRAARTGPVLLFLLLLLGGFRLLSGLANGRPVGFLLLTLIALTVTMVVLMVRVPFRTRAGRAAVGNLKAHYRYLAPAAGPAYATYGAAGVAMGVALFGAASLWALDPAFADAAEIQRNVAGSSGGGSSSSDSGSGCGGGDSGGGSSCGGGGGCGGGGCGG